MLPFVRGWRTYRAADLAVDAKAGASLALLTVPQSMAFALVAGLPVVHGIMAGAIGAVLGGLFCGSRFVACGPSTATAFTIFGYFAAYPGLLARQVELMPLLALLTGLILVVGSLLRFGELVQYISRSVMVGYLTGAAILIMANQMKDVLGVSLVSAEGDQPRTLLTIAIRLVENSPDTLWAAVTAAAATWLIYFAVGRWLKKWPGFIIALIKTSLTVWALGFAVPAFAELPRIDGWARADLALDLPKAGRSWLDDVSVMFGLAAALAFIASLETTVTSKSLTARSARRTPPDQDLFGVGLANMATAFASAMPSSTSLTRSALALALGVRSRLAMILNGLICIGLAYGLGAIVGQVPRAALAAMVIAAAFKLFNRRHLQVCYRATGSDAVTLVATIGATLLVPLHIAVFLGVGLSIMLYLRKAARPELVEYGFNESGDLSEVPKRAIPAISIVHVEGDLFFGAADLFRTQIQHLMRDNNLRVIILRLRNARNLDASSVLALEELLDAVKRDGRHLLISGVAKNVYRVLLDSDMVERIGRDNLFVHSPGNPNLSTRNALKRAQQILGTDSAEVQIFIDQNKKREGG